MKGLYFTVLILLSAVCFDEPEERLDGKCTMQEAGYNELKCFFDTWTPKPGIETIVIPKSFNWLLKRKLRKELTSVENIPAFVADIIDNMESIALIEYGALHKDKQLILENEFNGIIPGTEGDIPFKVILSGKNAEGNSYSRMIFHSTESKTFIIIKGVFSLEKDESQN